VAETIFTVSTNGTNAWPSNNGWHDPWYAWNHTQTWSTSTTTNVWVDWNTGYATTTNGTWNQWQTLYSYGSIRVHTMAELNGLRFEYDTTPLRADGRPAFIPAEEHWDDIRARNEAARLNREADAARVEARANAHKLLALVLSKAQMADYAAHRYFDVVGSEGGLYRIEHGTSGNIRQLVDGQIVNRLCVHPRLRDDDGGYLPTEDCLAAQALALMHDERGAVNRANVHAGRRHLRAVA